MEKYSLTERLSFHNPWWRNGKVPEALLPEFQREILSLLYSYLQLDRAILLKGPRRVGKTTLFYQLIDILIKENIPPEDICYISFDDPLLRMPLDDIFKIYEQYRGKKLNDGKIYFFLDEAQFLKDWELTVKLYLDRKFPIKFFISGSSASLLTQKVESLAGRTIEETLFPFSFSEYLNFFVPSLRTVKQLKRKELFPSYFPSSLMPVSREIKIQFANFLRKGGFPHIYLEKKELFAKLIKEDILDKVVFRDIVELFKIREPSYLEKLFYYLGNKTASIINLTTLSQTLGISRVGVERYISYLERSLLYFRLPKFSKSLKESLRSNPKGHLIDPALGNFFGASADQILESTVSAFLFSKFQKNLYFWRDQFHEVDCVISKKATTPIEVKNSAQKEVPKSLLYIMEKQKLSKGYIIYQGEFRKIKLEKKEIIFYPAWYFLLA